MILFISIINLALLIYIIKYISINFFSVSIQFYIFYALEVVIH